MSRGFSIYLDALRFSAAMLVLLSHFAYPRFSEGRWLWVRELNLGSDAVVIFFVLSGLVISHAVQAKPGSAGQYAFDRITRLVSVALPALLLAFVLDRLGSQIAPHLYAGWIYNPLPLWELLTRGLLFSNEWAGMETRLGSNGPYWSLSYEAAYYALFGIAIYTQGLRRVVLLAGGAWVFGLNIMLLLPAWLIGVAVHRLISRGSIIQAPVAFALTLLPPALYVLSLAYDVPQLLQLPIAQFDAALRFSDEFIWNTVLAGLVGMHLFGVASLLRDTNKVTGENAIRWLAGGSFSLYLIHYPVMQFIAALGFLASDVISDLCFVGACCIICYGFASLTERRLPTLRRGLRRFHPQILRQDPV